MTCGPYTTHHDACQCRQDSVRALVKAVHAVCKAFAESKRLGTVPAHNALADRIIEAERAARKL